MPPRKRKNSAPQFSSDRKGQPSFSLSQPPLSRSINHENTNLSTNKCKHPGDVSVMNKDINLLCYQCDKFIGSTDDKSGTKNYVFSCSVCQFSFHGDCLDFDSTSLDLIHAVFESVPWVCNACQELAKNARKKEKQLSKDSKAAAVEVSASDIKSLFDRISSLEKTVTDLQRAQADPMSVSSKAQLQMGSEQAVSNDVEAGPAEAQTSWSTIVKSGKSLRVQTTGDLIKAVHKDILNQKERKKNVVVSGLKSSTTISDKDLFKNLVGSHLNLIPVPQPSFTRRLKPSRSDKIPLLLVCFSSEEIATQIMSHARDLRTSQSEYIRSSVFINRDLTKAEAAAAFEIREKRRDKDRIKTHPSESSSTSSSSSSSSVGNQVSHSDTAAVINNLVSSVSSVLDNSPAQSMDYTDATGDQTSTHSSSDLFAPPLPFVIPSSSGTSVPPSLPVNTTSSCSSSSGKNVARASE